MFTGIVTHKGRVASVSDAGDTRLRIAADVGAIDLGASIACSGVCLTVVDRGEGWFDVDVSAETRARTAPGLWNEGAELNLERALRLGDELGGHIVTGHVDAVGRVHAVEPVGGSHRLVIAAGPEVALFIAPKGSVTIDGVSLTVNEVEDKDGGSILFSINLIPHTRASTTFDSIDPGREVNIEIDVMARYIARIIQARAIQV